MHGVTKNEIEPRYVYIVLGMLFSIYLSVNSVHIDISHEKVHKRQEVGVIFFHKVGVFLPGVGEWDTQRYIDYTEETDHWISWARISTVYAPSLRSVMVRTLVLPVFVGTVRRVSGGRRLNAYRSTMRSWPAGKFENYRYSSIQSGAYLSTYLPLI